MKIRKYISYIGTFLVLFGLITFVLDLTIGNIPCFNEIPLFSLFYLKDIVIILLSVAIILSFFRIYLPKRQQ